MWLDFKKYLICVLLVAMPFLGITQNSEGLVYNLKHSWVQYDVAVKSFLPVTSGATGAAISFEFDMEKYGKHTLYIKNTNKSYLFKGNVLLANLNGGEHFFKIDSLSKSTELTKGLFSIYGEESQNDLLTYVIDESFSSTLDKEEVSHFRSDSFTSFFILASILLLAGLMTIKFTSRDLFTQYASVARVFNLNTIDEIIYKGRFFVNPGIKMVVWMSFSAALILYYLINKLHIYFIEITWFTSSTIAYHSIYLLILAIGFVLLFLFRYLLVTIMSSIFDLNSTKNVHYATHLRLTFYLLLVLQFIVTLDYFSILFFNKVLFLTIIFGSLISIIVLIGLRLSFIIRHTFIQLFLYLCGTEIFLFVFVYKLVVG